MNAQVDIQQFCRVQNKQVVSDARPDSAIATALDFSRRLFPERCTFNTRDGQPRTIVQRAFLQDDFNAFASRQNSTYIVGISTSLYQAFTELFMCAIAKPFLLKNIGDTGKEVFSEFLPEVPLGLRCRSGRVDEEYLTDFMPRCEVRHRVSSILVSIAAKHVLQHEICHVLGGHVDYFREMTNRVIYEEAGFNSLTTVIDVYRHLSELQADAISEWISLLPFYLELFEKTFPSLDLSRRNWAHLCIFGMLIVGAFWTVLDGRDNIGERSWEDWREYPAGILRCRAVFQAIYSGEFPLEFDDTLQREICEALDDAMIDAQEFGRIYRHYGFLTKIGGTQWNAGIDEYRQRVIEPKLEGFVQDLEPYRIIRGQRINDVLGVFPDP